MEPDTNQPLAANPIAQPAVQPAPAEVSAPPPTPAPASVPESPKKKNSKVIILLVMLLLLAVGMIAYILFAKNQMNNAQKSVADNSSVITPAPSLSPTLAPENDLEISDPEADLLDLDADVKGL
jgi:uncharacterized protein HemX